MRCKQIAITACRKRIACGVMVSATGLRNGTECGDWLTAAHRNHPLADSRREHDQAHGKDAKPCDHGATGVQVHKLGWSQTGKSSIRLLPAGADNAAFAA